MTRRKLIRGLASSEAFEYGYLVLMSALALLLTIERIVG